MAGNSCQAEQELSPDQMLATIHGMYGRSSPRTITDSVVGMKGFENCSSRVAKYVADHVLNKKSKLKGLPKAQEHAKQVVANLEIVQSMLHTISDESGLIDMLSLDYIIEMAQLAKERISKQDKESWSKSKGPLAPI